MQKDQISLAELFEILARFRAAIVAVAVAGAGLGFAYASVTPDVYRARTTVVVRPIGSIPLLETGSYAQLEVSLGSLAVLARSEPVAARVITRLGLSGTSVKLAESITTEPIGPDSITISALAATPQRAADVATAFTQEFLGYRLDQARTELTQSTVDLKAQIEVLQAQIDELDARIVRLAQQVASLKAQRQTPKRAGTIAARSSELGATTAERDGLIATLGPFQSRSLTLDTFTRLLSGGGSIVEAARVPTLPAGVSPLRAALLGLFVGAGLGAALGFTRHHFDDRIRDVRGASSAVGAPILGVIPHDKAWRKRDTAYLASVEDQRGPVAESTRALAQALRALGLGSSLHTLLVTSGGPRAGKTSTVANLSVALARGGARVVVVSADFHRPRLHAFFGASNEVGLMDVLAGAHDLDDLPATAIANLWILASGDTAKNHGVSLDDPRLDLVLAKLNAVADIVLIDGPPLRAGADATVLAARADATLLCLADRRARASGVEAATSALRNAGARLLTAVLTNAEPRGARGDYAYRAPVSTNGVAHTNGVSSNGAVAHGSLDLLVVPKKKRGT